MHEPIRINIFGTKFSNININDAFKLIKDYNCSNSNYICFPSTNVISKAYKDRFLQHIFNNSFLTLADGKITEIYARLKGFKKIKTISGFWLMDLLLRTDLSHFFYGADNDTLYKLKLKIKKNYPDANVLGYKSPPYIKIRNIFPNNNIINDIKAINKLKPSIIWIGISNPKQDYLMYHYKEYLDQSLMIGVGGVFLYLSGKVKKSPEWIKQIGMRWLYRLIQEPRRIWKSTIPSTCFFLFLVLRELWLFLKNKLTYSFTSGNNYFF